MNIYFGNNLKELLENYLIKPILDQPDPNPIHKEIIVVQNQGMAIWLKQLIANTTGITCNVDFPFINSFINDILEKCLETPPDRDYFHPYVMTWKIRELFTDLSSDYKDLKNYFRSDPAGLKQFQLAREVAHCFDQYQIYRPEEILNNLERLQDFPWQQLLWQQLSSGKTDRAKGFQKFLTLKKCPDLKSIQRLFIVGIFSMPPVFIDFFEHLSKFIDIHLFLSLPVDFRFINHRKINPLLETLGTAGMEFFQLLEQKNTTFYSNFTPIQPNKMLSVLQKSFQDSEITSIPIPQEKLPSIQIHNCHSRMREAEVLRNNILHLINQCDYQPADFLVMMPDIAAYSPYIKAVFDREDIWSTTEAVTIPYTITDNSVTFETPVGEIFLQLLHINRTRFEATFVLDLLEQEAIYKKLQLTGDDIKRVRKWISETNIRWGLNSDQRKEEYDLINFDENSWEKGLDRMFLGFCLKDDDYPKLHYSRLPYDQFEGHHNLILGKLSQFISLLAALHQDFQTPAYIDQWQEKLNNLLDVFFYDFDEYQKDLKLLRKRINKLAEISEQAEIKSKISIEILQQYFKENLSDEFQTNRYFRGGITFSTLQPLRNIPTKVLCLMGMNDNDFPRNEHFNSFNLLGHNRELGDRIKREEDQYLFLEALMAPQEYLIISYTGQDIKTNEVSEPASPVCELRDYLKKLFSKEISDIIYFQHKLQPHNPIYFSDNRFYSYSQRDFLSLTSRTIKNFFTGPLNNDIDLNEIYIEDMIRHLSNSAKFFTENILGARIEQRETEILDAENFALNSLEKYQVNQFIQAQIIKQNTPDFIYSILKAKDDLPVSHTGKQIFDEYYAEMEAFLKTDIEELDASLFKILQASEPISVDFELKGIRIFGQLPPVFKNNLIHSRYGNFKGKDALKSWIYHLIGTISGQCSETYTFEKNKAYRFPELSLETAKIRLMDIVELYKQSHQKPLPFFSNTALKYCQHNPNSGKKKSKIDSARTSFTGFFNKYTGESIPGEKDDPYIQLYFSGQALDKEDFKILSKTILSPFAKYFDDGNDYEAKAVKK